MSKFYKLPNDIQNYIIKEFESHSKTINDKGNIKVILNDDESRKLARAINIMTTNPESLPEQLI